ncbi:MAG: aminopeptidase N [Succinivibrionaceae bacterium]
MSTVRKEKRRLDYKAPDFTITDVDLTLFLDMNATKVISVTKVKRLTDDLSVPLVLDGDSLKLLKVLVNGNEYPFVETPDSLTLSNLPSEFELTIETEISPIANSALMGLYVSDGKFCTQCEPEGFRRITFFLDHPDVLAKYTTHIIAKDGEYPYMLSNGNMIKDVTENGMRTVTWQDPFPKPSYLFALVAGDFDELTRVFTTKSGKNVDVHLFVDKGMKDRGEWAIESILKSMKWDENRFDLEYDLNNFMVVAVDFFNAGAMENKGLNIFNSKFVLADAESATDNDIENVLSVIGHEYFHNWTGDRVTCRDWFQLSLKEGLTVFRDQEFSSDLCCRPIERIKAVNVIRGPQFAEDASPMAHPIRPDFVMEMNNFYSVTVYDKGAEVIRMIHTILGEEKFQKGMKLYFKRHDGKAVTCEDFVTSMEDASGISLNQFRNWYSQAGTPEVNIDMCYTSSTKQLSITLKQSTPATPNQEHKKPFVIPVSLAFYDDTGVKLPLKSDNKIVNSVQLLTKEEETWVFDELETKPIVALFQNFSAPIKYEYAYTEEELISLLKYADDAIVRYDAIQRLINDYVKKNVLNIQKKGSISKPSTIVSAFKYILSDRNISSRFAAFLLNIPSIATLMELFKSIDLDAIEQVRTSLVNSISLELKQEFKSLYMDLYEQYSERINSQTPYECTEEQIGLRSLSNVALGYYVKSLVLEDNLTEGDNVVLAHYNLADNMTDTLTAMNIATLNGLNCQNEILAKFEAKWENNPLVFDNYFRAVSLAPLPNTLSRVKDLLKHKCFDINNPNRVRALVGTFVMANPICFNKKDGSGYEFLTSILKQLNSSNPHVAARIMTPMISLNRLDSTRKDLITKCFKDLLSMSNLSDSIYEKIDKALK